MDTLLNDYQAIATRHSLNEMQATTLSMASDTYPTTAALWQQIHAFAPSQGWIALQSKVVAFNTSGDLPEQATLIAAELYNAHNNTSLHIQQTPHGQWLATEYSTAEGESVLVQELSFFNEQRDLGKLRYKLYWAAHPQMGMVQKTAQFIGFDTTGAQPS